MPRVRRGVGISLAAAKQHAMAMLGSSVSPSNFKVHAFSQHEVGPHIFNTLIYSRFTVEDEHVEYRYDHWVNGKARGGGIIQ